MIILSIDSATPVAGVAVIDENKILGENFLNTGNTHSEKLLPLIEHTLEGLKMDIHDIDGIAVSIGPGSFTGLRIGLATAKALAQVTGIKLIAIPTLDALAQNLAGLSGYICPILDARKKEVYTALYRSDSGELQRLNDYRAITPIELCKELKERGEPVTFLGDGVFVYRKIITEELGELAHYAPIHNMLPRASALAMLGLRDLQIGRVEDLFSLKPFYLRKSEAEINWEAKRCKR